MEADYFTLIPLFFGDNRGEACENIGKALRELSFLLGGYKKAVRNRGERRGKSCEEACLFWGEAHGEARGKRGEAPPFFGEASFQGLFSI